MLNSADIDRLEEKLDMIIEFFNIGKQPKQSKKQIDDWAKSIVLDLQKRKRGK
jgi:hypothetical protein